MPLKLKKRGQYWYIRGAIRGQSVYETTGTSDFEAAESYRAKKEAELYEASVFGKRAVVSFERAALSYLDHEPRRQKTKNYLAKLVDHFGKTRLAAIDQEAADMAVEKILKPGAKPATVRRNVLGPLTAVLRHAHKRKWCEQPAFDLPRIPKSTPRWLTPDEYLELEAAAAPHLKPLLRFMACTGARLSEALYLDWSNVDLRAAKVMFRIEDTKGAKERVALLPPAALASLTGLDHRTGTVFRRDDGEPYQDRFGLEGGQIKTAWKGACRRANFGAWHGEGENNKFRHNVTPHDLRHTWATWFYAASRDPMALKEEGGWARLDMVDRYAHLMPSHLASTIRKVWGPSHPRIGSLPRARAKSVQTRTA